MSRRVWSALAVAAWVLLLGKIVAVRSAGPPVEAGALTAPTAPR